MLTPTIQRYRPHVLFACLLFLASLFAGCPTAEVKKAEPKPPPVSAKKPTAPELTVRVATMNLLRNNRRFERPGIDSLAFLLKREQVDIVAIEGISRYPGVATRLDIVDELGLAAGMRTAFGETANLSGRQGGNAVLTNYPIRSTDNLRYDGIQSTGFESALQAVVDCGLRDIVFVSTLFPERASSGDLSTCANRLAQLPVYYVNTPLIIAGNLPKSDAIRMVASFESTRPLRGDLPIFWYSNDGSLKFLTQRVEPTPYGPIVIAEFGMFRKTQP